MRMNRLSGIQVDIQGPIDDLKIELSWDGGKPFIERVVDGSMNRPRGTEAKRGSNLIHSTCDPQPMITRSLRRSSCRW